MDPAELFVFLALWAVVWVYAWTELVAHLRYDRKKGLRYVVLSGLHGIRQEVVKLACRWQ